MYIYTDTHTQQVRSQSRTSPAAAGITRADLTKRALFTHLPSKRARGALAPILLPTSQGQGGGSERGPSGGTGPLRPGAGPELLGRGITGGDQCSRAAPPPPEAPPTASEPRRPGARRPALGAQGPAVRRPHKGRQRPPGLPPPPRSAR